MKKIFLSLLLATFAIHGFSKEIISSFNDKDFVLLNGALLKENVLEFPKNSYTHFLMVGHTKAGILQNGKQYKLSVKVRVLGEFSPEKHIEIVVRSKKGYEQWGDIAKANIAHHGIQQNIKGYTWHHLEDGKTLILVPTELHEAYKHTGGASLLRAGLNGA